ncbi:MAG: hypothetical protein M9952_08495 [Microthrixaceae bacterium]|nr:hypothetical protein [Microthrixaceae bacterium]
MKRHPLDAIALIAGLLTIGFGLLGLAHQLGAFPLGPGGVALAICLAVGFGGIGLLVLAPKTRPDVSDPRLSTRGR